MRNKTQPRTKPANESARKTVRLELNDVQAQAVFIAGSFNDWKPDATPLQAAEPGRWAVELARLPGRYEYRLVVDGQWQPDPCCPQQAPNPFGEMNSVLEA
jgi:1,4-alpha-glucan branching enzyme